MDTAPHHRSEAAREHHTGAPITLADLVSAFPDDEAARRWFEDIRWNGNRRCPRCGSRRTNHVPHERPMPYHCMDCRQYFNVLTGTVLQWSKMPLRQWAFGIHAMSNLFSGLSSKDLHRVLGFNYRITTTLIHKIRQGVLEHDDPAPAFARTPPDAARADSEITSATARHPPIHT